MTIGVGGSSIDIELDKLNDMTDGVVPVQIDEFRGRIARAQELMQAQGVSATYVNAGTNLYYFTGLRWAASERMVGAIIPAQGGIEYIAPAFERGTVLDYIQIKGKINCWQEHESPYKLFREILERLSVDKGLIAVDESAAVFIYDGLIQASPESHFINAKPVTAGCRSRKSDAEIALLQRAKSMTLEVHKSAARILKAGMSTLDVTEFINQAHKRVGAPAGSYFCIVLFGQATAYPHGVKDPQILKHNDMVLIDTGCQLEGYNSDITRTYVFGEPDERQTEIWNIEKAAQQAAFDAADIGRPCALVDMAARNLLIERGLGPGYTLPGLPHRTGHGIGLDIHEWPYLVMNDETRLASGMCFSNEPMICIPGEFGIRLEDHFYMTDDEPVWFTQPSHSINDPFGYEA